VLHSATKRCNDPRQCHADDMISPVVDCDGSWVIHHHLIHLKCNKVAHSCKQVRIATQTPESGHHCVGPSPALQSLLVTTVMSSTPLANNKSTHSSKHANRQELRDLSSTSFLTQSSCAADCGGSHKHHTQQLQGTSRSTMLQIIKSCKDQAAAAASRRCLAVVLKSFRDCGLQLNTHQYQP
jgi:hypothetical protein